MNSAVFQPRTWPVWDLFFPPVCSLCGRALQRDDLFYCGQCWVDAPVSDNRDLHRLNYVDMVRAGYRYGADDVVMRSVRELKYLGMKRLATVMAAKLLVRVPPRFVEADLTWCVVPLHWRRQLLRGFNQSQVLAMELARLTGHDKPVPLLRRIRYTPTQTARTYRDRAANIKNAFEVKKNGELPKAVLLMDDVITTGATVDECARVLKNAGVDWVGVLTFALAHPA
jgi:ComF family protein